MVYEMSKALNQLGHVYCVLILDVPAVAIEEADHSEIRDEVGADLLDGWALQVL